MDKYSKFEKIINETSEEGFENMNSITFIKLIVRLEEEFIMEFEDDKLFINAFSTKKDLFDYVTSRSRLKNDD